MSGQSSQRENALDFSLAFVDYNNQAIVGEVNLDHKEEEEELEETDMDSIANMKDIFTSDNNKAIKIKSDHDSKKR